MTATQGKLPRLLLIHGWGFGPGVWKGLIACLGERAEAVAPALPGYGADDEILDHDPLAQAEALLLPLMSAPTIVVGWSCGGLAALRLAQVCPERVRALVLIASLPRFRRAPDWPAGLEQAGIAAVRRQLRDGPEAALASVAALSARGDGAAATVRQALDRAVPPALPPAVLERDLRLLAEADLRSFASAGSIPVHAILGAADHVIGPDCAGPIRLWCPSAHIEILHGAGHAPMVSQAGTVASKLEYLL